MIISDERLFPYPVLREGNNNFSSGEFDVKTEYGHSDTDYEFKLNVTLTEKNLIDLVENEAASIVCHLECVRTKFRTIKKLTIGENIFRINVAQLDGRLELVAIIVANKNISEYKSASFDADYNKGLFKIQTGNILGISEIPSVIIENRKVNNSNMPSIFNVEYDILLTDMKIGLNDERITIRLPEVEYRIRSAHKDNILSRNIMNSMMVLPTLIAVLHELAKPDSINNYGNYRWFQVISKKLKEHDCDLQNGELEESDIFYLSQKLLDEMFKYAMDSLDYMGGSEQ
ncbi:MAG: hypothetical protein KKF65_00795 [Nanoarchaeota archaeon]|nr:hypothetical protein [Nanoarchaeota archaeon]